MASFQCSPVSKAAADQAIRDGSGALFGYPLPLSINAWEYSERLVQASRTNLKRSWNSIKLPSTSMKKQSWWTFVKKDERQFQNILPTFWRTLVQLLFCILQSTFIKFREMKQVFCRTSSFRERLENICQRLVEFCRKFATESAKKRHHLFIENGNAASGPDS